MLALNLNEGKFMMKLALGLIVVFLFGCKSEIDKCVEAQINARGKFDDLALKHGALNIKSKEEVEADARLKCLSAGGK
jgi:hypothetical protein